MIKIGDTLPAVNLAEYVEVEGNGCSIGPNPVKLPEALAGKTIAVTAEELGIMDQAEMRQLLVAEKLTRVGALSKA